MTYGKFVGEVVATWCVEPSAPDRKMLLVEDFQYVAPDGKGWLAPKGRKVDGASIPEFLWGSVIGSPFTGDFRRASVVHDIACEDKPYTSNEAHLMFYNAMRCDNTSRWLAKVMYTAVRLFGPQWRVKFMALEQNTYNISAFYQLIHSSEFDAIDTPEDIEYFLYRTETHFRPTLKGD